MFWKLTFRRFYSSKNLKDINFFEKGSCGIIQIDNKQNSLNILTGDMFRSLYMLLREMENKKSHVIVKGNGKCFSAGGNVKAVAANQIKYEMKYCYRSFDLAHTYRIPYISLINGMCFGGAAVYSIAPKDFRVVTEKTIFSMPEVVIGFFNDAGASYFLPRIKRNVGFYMSLAAARIHGGDIKKIGLADYFVLSERLEELENSLTECKNKDEIKKTLKKFSSEPESSELEAIISKVDKCFDGDSVEEIIENLHLDGSEWAMKTINRINSYSPTSLKVSFHLLKMGKKLSPQECLKIEARLAYNHAAGSDFQEGVRALLIDKDNKPNYNPKTLHEVTDEHVEKFFKPISIDKELTFETRD